MEPYLKTDTATLYHARAEEVYPHIEPGSVSMVWGDGPYALGKGEWDKMGMDGLADWYAPHIEAWGRVCAPSATVYLWNTAEGWARIDPVMRAAGWTFRALITWDKGIASLAGRIDTESLQTWPDTTEVCGFYQREPNEVDLWNTYGATHPTRLYLERARVARGLSLGEIDQALGTADMARHWFTWSQWCLPSKERYEQLRRLLPELTRPLDVLRREKDAVWSAFRAEWARLRVPFTCPVGVSNVWSHPQVSGRERLMIDGETHPCQKPLAFASRAILASTRPGDTILDPFAGTNRIAVACRRLPPDERRHAIGIEMEQRWLDAVRPSLVADHAQATHARQPSLFAGGRVR